MPVCEARGVVHEASELLYLLIWHFALTGLPAAAAIAIAGRAGVRSVALLLAIALAAGGTAAMLAFWAYYAAPPIGDASAGLLVVVSVGVLIDATYRRRLDGALVRALATPFLLWGCACVFVLFLGFAHGGTDTALGVSATRFTEQLPTDNDIPRYFAEWFFQHGHSATPPVYPPDWRSSERPPLQIGYVLSQRIFGGGDRGLNYQVLGVVLQQLWVIGLWALMLAAKLGRKTRGLIAVSVLASPLVIINGFYVWPKLLPTAFLLAAAALVLTPLWHSVRGEPRALGLVGLLLALAMLGHGSSVFGVLALIAVAAARSRPAPRAVALAALAALVLYLPWVAYQRYGDPPADRLTKWMLAGAVRLDDRGVGTAIVDGYAEAGFAGTLSNKGENLRVIVGERGLGDIGDATSALGDAHFEDAFRAVRVIDFRYLLPSLGLLLVGPLALAARGRDAGRSPVERRFAFTALGCAGIGCLIWALLLFGEPQSRTSLHLGSFLIPVLALCGAIAALRTAWPRAATVLVCTNVGLNLLIFAPAFDAVAGTSYSPVAALLAAMGLAGFAIAAFKLGFVPGESDAPDVRWLDSRR